MQSYGAMTLLQAKKKQREDSFLQLLLPLLNHFIIERKKNIFKSGGGGGGEFGGRERDRCRQWERQQYRNTERDWGWELAS